MAEKHKKHCSTAHRDGGQEPKIHQHHQVRYAAASFTGFLFKKSHKCRVCVCVCVLTALVSPNVQLLGELRYHQEGPPALTLLGLQNVSKNVVPNVDDVLPFDAQ